MERRGQTVSRGFVNCGETIQRFDGTVTPAGPAGDVTQFNTRKHAANCDPLPSVVGKSRFPSPLRSPSFRHETGERGRARRDAPSDATRRVSNDWKIPTANRTSKNIYLRRQFRFREIHVGGKHRGTSNKLQDFWMGRVHKSFLERRFSPLTLSGGRRVMCAGWYPHKGLP